MSTNELIKRYLLFVVSAFVNAFGISVITKAMLGTSAISSLPFVLSLFTPATMGLYTIGVSTLCIMLELTMMKKAEIKQKRYEIISQLPIGILFGVFIDISLHSLLSWFSPTNYFAQFATLLIGCFILATGISLAVKANVAMVSGEYLVNVMAKFFNKKFGLIKVCFDVTLVLIASTLSIIFLHDIQGVREGTVITALIVGPISQWLLPYWRVFDHWLCSPQKAQEQV